MEGVSDTIVRLVLIIHLIIYSAFSFPIMMEYYFLRSSNIAANIISPMTVILLLALTTIYIAISKIEEKPKEIET